VRERIRLSFRIRIHLNALEIKLLDVQLFLLRRAMDANRRVIDLCDVTIELCERRNRIP